MNPVTRKEVFLDAICDGEPCTLEPASREEQVLKKLAESMVGGGASGAGNGVVFGEGTKLVPATIEWDGNTDGKAMCWIGGYDGCCFVSDKVIEDPSKLIGKKATLVRGGVESTFRLTEDMYWGETDQSWNNILKCYSFHGDIYDESDEAVDVWNFYIIAKSANPDIPAGIYLPVRVEGSDLPSYYFSSLELDELVEGTGLVAKSSNPGLVVDVLFTVDGDGELTGATVNWDYEHIMACAEAGIPITIKFTYSNDPGFIAVETRYYVASEGYIAFYEPGNRGECCIYPDGSIEAYRD